MLFPVSHRAIPQFNGSASHPHLCRAEVAISIKRGQGRDSWVGFSDFDFFMQYGLSILGARVCPVTIQNMLDVSASFSGSGLQIATPRRPARVQVLSFDVCIALRSRKRSGESIRAPKVDNHGSDFRIFGYSLGNPEF